MWAGALASTLCPEAGLLWPLYGLTVYLHCSTIFMHHRSLRPHKDPLGQVTPIPISLMGRQIPRHEVTCPKSHSQQVAEAELEAKVPAAHLHSVSQGPKAAVEFSCQFLRLSPPPIFYLKCHHSNVAFPGRVRNPFLQGPLTLAACHALTLLHPGDGSCSDSAGKAQARGSIPGPSAWLCSGGELEPRE